MPVYAVRGQQSFESYRSHLLTSRRRHVPVLMHEACALGRRNHVGLIRQPDRWVGVVGEPYETHG